MPIAKKKQGRLLPNLGKPDLSQEQADNPVMFYPFKISGRDMNKFLDYTMQKYLQAFFGLISWDNVTYRDLAGVFILSAKYKKLRLYKFRDTNWVGNIIKKRFLNRDFVTKQNFISVAVNFAKIYKDEFNGEDDLNWNYIDKHHNHREEILDRVEEQLNKTKSRPKFF